MSFYRIDWMESDRGYSNQTFDYDNAPSYLAKVNELITRPELQWIATSRYNSELMKYQVINIQMRE